MFSSQLSWKSLTSMCRSLATMLRAGVPLVKALKLAGGKTAHQPVQLALADVSVAVRQGETISGAMRDQGGRFPVLVIDLVDVAEQTGALPEVLSALADHYENLLRLRRTFISAIIWPVLQLVMAVLIVAGLILVLGWIAEVNGNSGFDPLGFGLKGESGALTWLGLCAGSVATVWLLYSLLTAGFRAGPIVYRLLQRLPVIGACLCDFALARFSWAFALTQQAGMPIGPSLEASLKATGNPAFAATSPQVVSMVMQGEELSDALDQTNLIPPDFIEMVRIGETSGTVPEALQELSPELEARARRSLEALTGLAGWMIWALVAMMIVFLIFRIMLWYVSLLNSAASGNFDMLD